MEKSTGVPESVKVYPRTQTGSMFNVGGIPAHGVVLSAFVLTSTANIANTNVALLRGTFLKVIS